MIIAYWARLAMGDLHLTWHALSEYDPGAKPRRAWSLVPVAPPQRPGATLTWATDALALSITMQPCESPQEVTLLDAPAGIVRWRGETAAARMQVARAGQAPFDGVGYAECLTLTVPPWQLPIDTLDWGRWISHDRMHSSIWFRWRGAHPLVLVVEDGHAAADAVIDGTTVSTATATLDIQPSRLLERRHLGEIVSPIPLLTRVLPQSLLALEESKWLGHGTRRDRTGATHDGWAVFETVHFRHSNA